MDVTAVKSEGKWGISKVTTSPKKIKAKNPKWITKYSSTRIWDRSEKV